MAKDVGRPFLDFPGMRLITGATARSCLTTSGALVFLNGDAKVATRATRIASRGDCSIEFDAHKGSKTHGVWAMDASGLREILLIGANNTTGNGPS
ncbi:uncharacterized protein PG998_000065 [Apiospora kogelbergensis]|uniref:uncharacterized protein n=1 Tax=Apiospora kogelbergensis TaxID=1337665 RepID=UPI00312E0438